MSNKKQEWTKLFNERELRLITNCLNYVNDNPAGLPGHNLMIIIAKIFGHLGEIETDEDKQA